MATFAKDLTAALAQRPPPPSINVRRHKQLETTRLRVLYCHLDAPPLIRSLDYVVLICHTTGTALAVDASSWRYYSMSGPPLWPLKNMVAAISPPPLPSNPKLIAWTAFDRYMLLGFGDQVVQIGPGLLRIFKRFPHPHMQQVIICNQYCVARAANHMVAWKIEEPDQPRALKLPSNRHLWHQILFLAGETLVFATWDLRTVNLVHYYIPRQQEFSFKASLFFSFFYETFFTVVGLSNLLNFYSRCS